ncbi:AraC family transcriptional regulator [Paenibacillus macerans]|uniref:helix-turn-helix transcriptional regulator n=1 Tax=Paenibacillus macerans TaxID=44252 RepID=UPI003D317E95
MASYWAKPNIAEYNRQGIVYFSSELEMRRGLPCKMYRITEEIGSLSDHMHDYLQIWYVSKGEFVHSLYGQRYRMVQGNIFVIPPYGIHRVDIVPGKELEVLGCEFMPAFINERLEETTAEEGLFDFAYLERFLAPEEWVPLKIALTGHGGLAAKDLLSEMLEEYTKQEPFFVLLLKANLLKLLALLNREHARLEHAKPASATGHPYREPILESVQYIHDHYDQPLGLAEVCARSIMSRTNFCRRFKQVTGRTFSQYVSNYRVRIAMRLLAEPGTSVTEVCYKVGFNELSYFCRTFKKYTGTTPAYYRENAFKTKA